MNWKFWKRRKKEVNITSNVEITTKEHYCPCGNTIGTSTTFKIPVGEKTCKETKEHLTLIMEEFEFNSHKDLFTPDDNCCEEPVVSNISEE